MLHSFVRQPAIPTAASSNHNIHTGRRDSSQLTGVLITLTWTSFHTFTQTLYIPWTFIYTSQSIVPNWSYYTCLYTFTFDIPMFDIFHYLDLPLGFSMTDIVLCMTSTQVFVFDASICSWFEHCLLYYSDSQVLHCNFYSASVSWAAWHQCSLPKRMKSPFTAYMGGWFVGISAAAPTTLITHCT